MVEVVEVKEVVSGPPDIPGVERRNSGGDVNQAGTDFPYGHTNLNVLESKMLQVRHLFQAFALLCILFLTSCPSHQKSQGKDLSTTVAAVIPASWPLDGFSLPAGSLKSPVGMVYGRALKYVIEDEPYNDGEGQFWVVGFKCDARMPEVISHIESCLDMGRFKQVTNEKDESGEYVDWESKEDGEFVSLSYSNANMQYDKSEKFSYVYYEGYVLSIHKKNK